MSAEVLLDTSFLITLVDANRSNPSIARRYYQYLLRTTVPMRLSAIVAAEFAIKQPITDLPLGNFRPLDFNLTHGQQAANLWNALGQRDADDARAVVRDDVKLLAQASREQIDCVLTEDASTLQKYCERLRSAGYIKTRAIVLGYGFDPSALRSDGQKDWIGDSIGDAQDA